MYRILIRGAQTVKAENVTEESVVPVWRLVLDVGRTALVTRKWYVKLLMDLAIDL